MKKQLPNRKTLSQFFYILSIVLLFANGALAQKTIINETFGTAVIASPYTGGTSTVPASPSQITYTKTSTAATAGVASVTTSSGNGYLSLTANGATSGRTFLTAPLPAANFVSILKNNPYPITWSFNMRINRTTNIAGLASSAATNYVGAEVLVASSSDLLSTSTNGYAVSLSSGSSASFHKIELSSFTQGLGLGSGVAIPVNILSSPDFAAENYVSVKVTYTPSSDTWSLAVKSNGSVAFSDPSTDIFPTPVTADNNVNTSVTMTHFGYFYSHIASGTLASSVFRNDNYKMVLESPFVALPTVEPRQAFNNSPAPTVANLVAKKADGATLNWYSVLGGSKLTSNTAITSGTYYVSQTVGTDESDVVSTYVYVGDTSLKTLPLHESFDYAVGQSLIVMDNAAAANAIKTPPTATGIGLGSWTITPGDNITADVAIVASPIWINTVLPAATNNAISFVASGVDPELYFTDTTSGNLFSSFLFNIKDVPANIIASTPVVIYGFAASNSSNSASVMFRKNITTGKFNLGLSKSNSATECVWSDTEFVFDTQHLAVISYKNIGGATATDQVASLWIDPATSSPQPAATLSQNAPVTSVSRSLINEIKIQQTASASTPTIIIDEIRVATSWSEVLGGPAPTALPVVENRQAFDSTLEPTVGSLDAEGTDLKWYTAEVGGSPLDPSQSLTTANYYVSQTLNSLESDRVATNVYVGDTSLKTLPLYESFDYAVGESLIVMKNGANTVLLENPGTGLGSWTITPSNNITADVSIVASPTWTNTILPSATNNAITFAGSGIDPELKFTDTTTGSLYSSFVFTAADVATIVASTTTDPAYSTPTGFYGFLSESTDPVTSEVSTSYASDVMFRKNIATGKFNLGLSKSNSGTECVWSDTEFDFGTQHLIVISYENIGDETATNQVANLWIDPASSTQPAATLTQSAPLTSVTRSNLDRIKILQASSSSTPTLVIDEIRVANNWGEALGGTSTLGLSSQVASKSQHTVYPNPVSKGILHISSPSSSEKQVSIYSILGQKVIEAKTTNNAEINVSKLAKGNYILKITEDGKSEAKKLIVQ